MSNHARALELTEGTVREFEYAVDHVRHHNFRRLFEVCDLTPSAWVIEGLEDESKTNWKALENNTWREELPKVREYAAILAARGY